MTLSRVAITGIGGICGLGSNSEEIWQNSIAGKSAIRKHPKLTAAVQIAGYLPDFQISPHLLSEKEQDRFDLFIHYALHSIDQALKMSQLLGDNHYQSHRMGCILGVGMGGFPLIEKEHLAFEQRGPERKRTSAFFIPSVIPNMASGLAAIKFQLHGVNYAISSACASSGHAIEAGFQQIQLGKQDVVIVGGAEAVTTNFTVSGFHSMKALSKRETPAELACCPFDQKRDGFVIGEGAAVLVLENYEQAQKRGATILAELISCASTSDAHHITAPHPEGLGAAMCMKNALAAAQLNAEDIDYINAHGTSTPLGDIAETLAIKSIWKEKASQLSISSTKSMTGHLLGAASALESLFCVQSLVHQVIPPTINLTEPDAQCDLDYTPLKAKKKNIRYALNNSFGFGGTNSTLIFKRYHDDQS